MKGRSFERVLLFGTIIKGGDMNRILMAVAVFCLLNASAVFAAVGGGDRTFRVSGAGTVVYSHDDHVSKAGLKCSECHYKIFNTAAGHKSVTMEKMEKGQSCGACHNGTRTFDVKKNCQKCHS